MGFNFLNIGPDIVPSKLLDSWMGNHESLEFQEAYCFLVRGYVNSSTLHFGWNFLNICIKVAEASWVWGKASWTLTLATPSPIKIIVLF
jgi:hypothetical protein